MHTKKTHQDFIVKYFFDKLYLNVFLKAEKDMEKYPNIVVI